MLVELFLIFYLGAVIGHIATNIQQGYAWDDELEDVAYPWRWSIWRW